MCDDHYIHSVPMFFQKDDNEIPSQRRNINLRHLNPKEFTYFSVL